MIRMYKIILLITFPLLLWQIHTQSTWKSNADEDSNKKKKTNILTSPSDRFISVNQNKNNNIQTKLGESSNSKFSKNINIKSISTINDLKNSIGSPTSKNTNKKYVGNSVSDFYIMFPFANNRSDSDLLFASYIFKELSHNLLNYSNFSFLYVHRMALGLDFYIVGAFTEAYVFCNGSGWSFINYPFFHDTMYSKVLDASFGDSSPWIKGVIDFAFGIDANGNMSIGQFLINIISLFGVGVLLSSFFTIFTIKSLFFTFFPIIFFLNTACSVFTVVCFLIIVYFTIVFDLD